MHQFEQVAEEACCPCEAWQRPWPELFFSLQAENFSFEMIRLLTFLAPSSDARSP